MLTERELGSLGLGARVRHYGQENYRGAYIKSTEGWVSEELTSQPITERELLRRARGCVELAAIHFEVLPGGTMPLRSTRGAAGFDCYARETTEVLQDRAFAIVPLGFKVATPANVYTMLVGRSSCVTKMGFSVEIGIVDSDYRGEVSAVVRLIGGSSVRILAGDRVAQIVPTIISAGVGELPVIHTQVGESSSRGVGFGSSGR